MIDNDKPQGTKCFSKRRTDIFHIIRKYNVGLPLRLVIVLLKSGIIRRAPHELFLEKGVHHQFSSGWEIFSKAPASWENLRNTPLKDS